MKDEIQGWRDIIQQNDKRQQCLTISKRIADELDDIFNGFVRDRHSRSIWNFLWRAEEIDDVGHLGRGAEPAQGDRLDDLVGAR